MISRFYFVLGFYFLVLASGAGGCVFEIESNQVQPSKTPAPVSKTTSNPSPFIALEESVREQVNRYRAERNLPALKLDPRISEQCRAHSAAMANSSVAFGHQGFEQRVNAIGQMIAYRSAAENVAYNFGYGDPGKQAVEGWIKSPGHRKNMEGEFDLTGIGIAKNAQGEYYFTQIFIRR